MFSSPIIVPFINYFLQVSITVIDDKLQVSITCIESHQWPIYLLKFHLVFLNTNCSKIMSILHLKPFCIQVQTQVCKSTFLILHSTKSPMLAWSFHSLHKPPSPLILALSAFFLFLLPQVTLVIAFYTPLGGATITPLVSSFILHLPILLLLPLSHQYRVSHFLPTIVGWCPYP